jgi:hypothetical protein
MEFDHFCLQCSGRFVRLWDDSPFVGRQKLNLNEHGAVIPSLFGSDQPAASFLHAAACSII